MTIQSLLLCSALILSCGVAEAQSVTIRSLYQDRSFVPGALLPFQVRKNNAHARVVDVRVVPETSACRAMIDPFHADIFHLKCAMDTDSTISLQVKVLTDVTTVVSYGPLRVRNPTGTTAVAPTISNADFVAGQNLFNAYCIQCHTATDKRGATSARIQSGFAASATMRAGVGQKTFSQDELRKLENFLKGAP